MAGAESDNEPLDADSEEEEQEVDRGQGKVAECQAYADGEMLALLKAIK